MQRQHNLLGLAVACFLAVLLQGCLRPGTQGSSPAVWFRNAAYVYEFGSTNAKTTSRHAPIANSRMTLNIEDWNGYYDQYMHCYHVFPEQETVPTPEIVADMKHRLAPALLNVKDRMDTRRHGMINFGGIYFKGALISFHFEGEIKDLNQALSLMNNKEQTTVTLRGGVMNVDAPIPDGKRNDWTVTVVYPGKMIRSNAPAHDSEHKKLIWTNKTVTEKRILFEIETPKD